MTTMERPVELVLSRLRERTGHPGKRKGPWTRFPHPLGSGKDPALSLAVMEQPDGTVILHSHKPGHPTADVIADLGLTWADLFPADVRGVEERRDGSRVTARYEYTDKWGRPVGQVQRRMFEGGKKTFSQGHYEDGSLVPGLNGQPLPLYLLPWLETARAEGRTVVYLVEGEKDARALWAAGEVATTKAQGAGSPWIPGVAEPLRGMDVVIVADRDGPGAQAAQAAWIALEGIARTRVIVEAAEGKDAADHLAAGHSADDFRPRPDLIPTHPTVRRLHEAGAGESYRAEYAYCWRPWLIRGKLTDLNGDGGVGKTSFALAVAAGLGLGLEPGTGNPNGGARHTLFVAVEDDPIELRTLYQGLGGDQSKLHILPEAITLTPEGMDDLRALVRHTGAEFVYLDGVLDMMVEQRLDINNGLDVARVLKLLASTAAELDVALMFTRHFNKMASEGATSNRGMGSAMWRNKARSQAVLAYHPNSAERRGVVVVYHGRGSLLQPRSLPLAFRRLNGTLEWVNLPEAEREELDRVFLGGKPGDAPGPGRPSKRTHVEKAIVEALATGPQDCGVVKDQVMESTGCSRRTFFNAVSAMGLERDGFGRYLLPPSIDPFAEEDEA